MGDFHAAQATNIMSSSNEALPAGQKGTTQEVLLLLMEKKKGIEEQMEAYSSFLTSPGNPGMDEPLVDEDGFPRADIDLYKVREARNKIICLNNDLKAVTDEIKAGLEDMHSSSAVAVPVGGGSATASGHSGNNSEPVKMAFLRISDVADGSPADTAGFHDGDLVVSFGPIFRTDDRASGKTVRDQCTDVLHRMAKHIGDNKGVEMEVLIKRNGSMLDAPLKITPKDWSGAGMIGCRFHPLDANL